MSLSVEDRKTVVKLQMDKAHFQSQGVSRPPVTNMIPCNKK